VETAEDEVVVEFGGETTVVTQTFGGEDAATNLGIDAQGDLTIERQGIDRASPICCPPLFFEPFFRPRQYPFV